MNDDEFLAGWTISVTRNDSRISVSRIVPNDELEFGIDEVLAEARELEQNLGEHG